MSPVFDKGSSASELVVVVVVAAAVVDLSPEPSIISSDSLSQCRESFFFVTDAVS